MKKIILNIGQYGIFLGLGVLLLYLTFRGKDLNEIEYYLLSANYSWILLSLLLGYIALFVRAYRWNLLIEPLGYHPKLINTYHALTIGYMSNYALPRIGEVVRCGTLSRISKLPPEILIGTVIAERAFDLLCLFVLTFFVILFKFKLFGSFLKIKVFDVLSQKVSTTLDFSSLIWISLLIGTTTIICLIYIFRQKIRKIVVVQKVSSIGKGVIRGIKTVLNLKRKKSFLFHTFLMWTLYYLMTYVVVFSLPGTSKLIPVDGLFLLVLGSFGMAAPVQGGMGAFHSMIVLGLMGLYSIGDTESRAMAVLMHEPQMVGILIAGAVSLFIVIVKRKRNLISE